MQDFFAEWYVRFISGFAVVAMFIGIVNFGMIVVTMLTVRGIMVPAYLGAAAVLIAIAGCVLIGYVFEKTKFWDRITHHQNQAMNPEVREIHQIVQKIADQVGVKP